MRVEFRCIHALDGADARGELPGMGHKQRIFKDPGALGQQVKEKVRAGILGGLIVAQAALPAVSAKHIHRLGARCTHVFQVHELHIPIRCQHNAHFQFIAHTQCIAFFKLLQYRS